MALSNLTPPRSVVDHSAILRISIDGQWEAQQFAEFFRCITFLYRVSAADGRTLIDPQAVEVNLEMTLINSLDEFRESSFSKFDSSSFRSKRRLEWLGSETAILRVARISFGSPGVTDFSGMGRAFEKLCEFLKYVIDLALQSKTRKLDVLMKQEELEAKRIENTGRKIQNAARLLELAKATGCSPEVQRNLLFSIQEAQESLMVLSENGQIVSAEKLQTK
jgi:hypothetical protein